MRRRLGCLVVIAILAILLGVAWAMFGQRVRTFYVLKRCDWAWSRASDYQSEFELRTEVGLLSIPVRGTMWFKKPNLYRIDLGPDGMTACRIMASGNRTWVHMPPLKVALDVTFKDSDPADVFRSQSPAQWVDQLLESTDARVVGREIVEGRECYVVELTPSGDAKAAATPLAPPDSDWLLDPRMFLGRWARTRVYVSKKTALPVRGVALTERGSPIVTWTAKTLAVNQGLADSHFEFDPPEGVTVIEREFDPEHPESLLLPPDKLGKRSSWEEWFEAVGDEMEEQFKGLGDPDEPTDPSLSSFLEAIEKRLGDGSARGGAEAQPSRADSAE